VLEILRRLNESFNKTVVMVTHDPHAARTPILFGTWKRECCCLSPPKAEVSGGTGVLAVRNEACHQHYAPGSPTMLSHPPTESLAPSQAKGDWQFRVRSALLSGLLLNSTRRLSLGASLSRWSG